ncbi:MAG: hypothetical protein ABI895_33815 [Deltaproteobacteria bacterium]
MSADPRLPRWSEDGSEAPPELRQWLRASREQLGAVAEVAQLSRGLAARLGSEAVSAASLAPVVAGKAWLEAGRWALWLAAGAGTVAAILYWQSETPAPFVPPAVVQTSSAVPAVEQPSSAPEPPAVPEPAALLPAPEPARVPEPARAPAPERPRAPALAKAPRTSEAELLQRAQRALAEHPSQALLLTAEHRRRFADGALAEEREVIAIEALRHLGRERAARERAAVFETKYPNSVHRSRVQATPAAQ